MLVAEPPRRYRAERQFLRRSPLRKISVAGAFGRRFCFGLGVGSLVAKPFVSVTFLAYSRSQCYVVSLSMSRRLRRQANMSSRFHRTSADAPRTCACRDAGARRMALPSSRFAQSDDGDPEMRIQQLENQLRQLTGQNEELQHQNQLLAGALEELQGGAQAGARRSAARGSARLSQRCRRRVRTRHYRIRTQPQPTYQPGYNAAGRRLQAPMRRRRLGPASRRRLRSEPESQCARRAACARRRPDADVEGAGRRARRTRRR